MYTLHYAPDNASLIIRLALDAANAPYRTALVNRRTQAQTRPAYRALNPNGLIPALETPHGALFETAAILLWLSERHAGLMPAPDNAARGTSLSWLVYLSNTLHANLRVLFNPEKYITGDTALLIAQTKANLSQAYDTLNDRLPDAPGFAVEAYLATCLRWSALYGDADRAWFALSAWPRLETLAQRMDTHPATALAVKAEGLGPTPFSRPCLPHPPEGSAM